MFSRRHYLLTLPLGLAVILFSELFLFADVRWSHRGPVHSQFEIDSILATPANGAWEEFAREVAVNMTAIAWVGYLLAMEGLLAWQSRNGPQQGGPIWRRPHHFFSLFLASVFIWCVFDVINFHAGMKAWVYIGLPPTLAEKFVPYLLAFGSIVPGMLMSGQAMLNAGWFNFARGRRWTMHSRARIAVLCIGLGMFIWPVFYPNPVTNLTLWTSLVFLLDPINEYLGRPSMFRDWQNGWYGRTLAAFAGGLLCGFLWEFWNYWALTKWVYHLPFLGRWGQYHYFEMPLPGLIGFIPFGMECWVMWQTLRIPLDGMVEPLPDENSLL